MDTGSLTQSVKNCNANTIPQLLSSQVMWNNDVVAAVAAVIDHHYHYYWSMVTSDH